MISEMKHRCIYVVGDLLTTAFAWYIFNIIRFNDIIAPNESYPTLHSFLSVNQVWLGQILFPLLMMGLYYLSGYYNHVFLKSRVEELVSTATTALIGTIVIYFVAIVDDPIPDRASNYELTAMLFGLLFSCVYAFRLTLTTVTNLRISSGHIRFNAVIIGTSQSAVRLREKLESFANIHSHAYNIVGYVEPDTTHTPRKLDLPIFSMEELPAKCVEFDIKFVIATSHRNGMHSTLEMVNRLFPLDLPVLISPTLFDLIAAKPKLSRLAGEPLIDITRADMADSTVNMKRAGDIVFSLLALLALLPFFAILAIAIRCDSRGPIIYSQERIGYRKKPFKIYKFRTMVNDAEINGPALTTVNDTRITRLGRFLRKYRLDELPQFWNVLKGDMSIVGPRPERAFYIKQIMERAPYYMLIHQVRPGITSLGMVKHGYASTVEGMVERLQYDLIYIQNISLIADLKVMLYTVSTIFTGKGI